MIVAASGNDVSILTTTDSEILYLDGYAFAKLSKLSDGWRADPNPVIVPSAVATACIGCTPGLGQGGGRRRGRGAVAVRSPRQSGDCHP